MFSLESAPLAVSSASKRMAQSSSRETNVNCPCGSDRTAALGDQKSGAQSRADRTLGAKCGMQVGVDASACPYDRVLWREALAWSLVPSKATVPSFNRFISFAIPSTYTNSASISLLEEPLAERAQRVVIRVGIDHEVVKR